MPELHGAGLHRFRSIGETMHLTATFLGEFLHLCPTSPAARNPRGKGVQFYSGPSHCSAGRGVKGGEMGDMGNKLRGGGSGPRGLFQALAPNLAVS